MDRRHATFDLPHVQLGITAELDLRPFEINDLPRSHAMPVGNQDQ
jgi:hypothetical protein